MPPKPKLRVLTPEGEILKALIKSRRLPAAKIYELTDLGRTTVYSNLKDLIIAGWIKEKDSNYEATKEGIKAFWYAILDELAERLVSVSSSLGINSAKLVRAGIRLILDIVEFGLPEEVRRFLVKHDPSLLDLINPKEVIVSV